MQFPYPIVRLLRISNADGSTAIQIGPGPTATWYGTNGSQVVISAASSYPILQFWNVNHDNFSFINGFGSNSDANLGLNSGGFPSIRYPAITNAQVTELLTTSARDYEVRIESAPAQVPYGGFQRTDEISSGDYLLDNAAHTIAFSGPSDLNTAGAPFPVVYNAVTVGGVSGGALGGQFVDATSVQFKGSINENYPVKWDRTSRWLLVDQFDWTNLILINLWASVATYMTPAAKMMPDGVVVLSGSIKGGTNADNTQAFATPFTSMAPTASVLLRPAIDVSSTIARILINTLGQAFIYGIPAGAQLGLDGLQFRTVRP